MSLACVRAFATSGVQCVCSEMGAECVNCVINCANGKRVVRRQDSTEAEKGREEGERQRRKWRRIRGRDLIYF